MIPKLMFQCTKCPRILTKGRIIDIKKVEKQPVDQPAVLVRYLCECRPHVLTVKYPLSFSVLHNTVGTRHLPWENPTPPMSNEDIDKAVAHFAFDLDGLAGPDEFEWYCRQQSA